MAKIMTEKTKKRLRWAARNEITEYHIYKRVAERTKIDTNRKILLNIAAQEKNHYEHWKNYLNEEVAPSRPKILWFTWLASMLGTSFSLKLMEKGEGLAIKMYKDIGEEIPEALSIMADEQEHEEELLKLINEKYLQYVSSIVLGLNDALVELTGALAGLTLALQDTRLIAMVGLITGIAASLAMTASEYLSNKEEEGKNAIQAGIFTGIAYILTVLVLVAPYMFMPTALSALAVTLALGIGIVLVFTFYTAIAKDLPFKKRFLEMAAISLGVAAVNFVIGYAVKQYFGL